ncbi:MAG: hypothetical protein HUJ26_22690 [Planctomycetaceae bacterium]|nr:hypothetical protein [Planctomycetaceae bacterium]
MRSISKMLALLAVVCSFWLSTKQGEAETRFTVVDSSSSSWVARGYHDYTVSPDNGWTFTPSRNFDNGVGFYISGPALAGTTVTYWRLNFAAPFNALLVPGEYADFQRFPFQDNDRPGLEFASTGRLDNQAAGTFEILEATYGPSGEVLTFAADFIHYGETLVERYAIVEVRYNYDETPPPVEVEIDVEPGKGGPKPSRINLRSKKTLPVAILSTTDFDATEVVAETVLLGDPVLLEAGSGIAVPSVGGSVEDVNGDGMDDLLVLFQISEISGFGAVAPGSVEVLLIGETTSGTPIYGFDNVRVTPKKKKK